MADDEEDQIPFFSQFPSHQQATQGSSAGENLGREMGFLDLNSNVEIFRSWAMPTTTRNDSTNEMDSAAMNQFRAWVANILLAHAGRGGSSGMTEAAAEIARAAARSWLAPLTETIYDRLAFVLQSLFDLAMERSRTDDSRCYDDLAAARA
ncbi:hypothetical protein ZWY2020_013813 [Hordeum vulgare]|nr:hypothetical protein ZWY2020_013813 [Hordeum vulgare]